MKKTKTEEFVSFFNSHQIAGDVCPGSAKKRFMLWGKAALKELADSLGLVDYDLRFNAGGVAVSGECTLHANNIYVQISDGFMGKSRAVLFRTCKGKKDYSRGTNNFAPVDDMANGRLAAKIKMLLGS